MMGLVPFKNCLARKDDVFGRLMSAFDEDFFQGLNMSNMDGRFKVDVKDNVSEYELSAELPGLTKDEITLDYTDGYLTISANKTQSKDEGDDKTGYIRRERSFGSMSRSFYIDNIDKEKATADFKNGILTVKLPKVEKNNSVRHEIKITESA